MLQAPVATVLMLAALAATAAAGHLRQGARDLRESGRRIIGLRRVSAEELIRLESLPATVAIRGRTAPGPEGLVRAPLSNVDCVWYRTTVEPAGSDGSDPIALTDEGARVHLSSELAGRTLVAGAPALVHTIVTGEQVVPAGLAVLAVGRPRRNGTGVVLEPTGSAGSGITALTDGELTRYVHDAAGLRARFVSPLVLCGLALFLLGLWCAAEGW
jgi:hypothetical protein